ncbi:MAG: hypothetical protein J2P27_12115 [Actinobacteria bacterium]|nr:hypothetical protein [Actinomycetota bacterium]
MRVYLPSTLPAVAGLLRAGEIKSSPVRGYAVTPVLREWYASGDDEELEYVAMMHAARESLRLLAADSAAPRRRVVLAAEVSQGQVTTTASFAEPAVVAITGPVQLADIAAGHVDDAAAGPDIAAAVAALAAADDGDEDAQFAVDGAEGHELAWYATQELADLAASHE